MKLKNIISIVISIIISIIFVVNDTNKDYNSVPIEAYRVYLDGKTIGLIESKEELERYINSQQESLKEKYKVDKIYIPNEIDIIKDITYDENIDIIS